MATKSFLNNISIKDKQSAWAFLNALENAEGRKGKSVKINAPVKNVTDEEEIRKLFKD